VLIQRICEVLAPSAGRVLICVGEWPRAEKGQVRMKLSSLLGFRRLATKREPGLEFWCRNQHYVSKDVEYSTRCPPLIMSDSGVGARSVAGQRFSCPT